MTLIEISAHIYFTIFRLWKLKNNILLLLIWSLLVFPLSIMDYSRPLKVLSKWEYSEDFSNLYKKLAEEFQGHQSVEQLALIMVPLTICRRFLHNFLDHFDQPIKGIYLADLDAFLRGKSLRNWKNRRTNSFSISKWTLFLREHTHRVLEDSTWTKASSVICLQRVQQSIFAS